MKAVLISLIHAGKPSTDTTTGRYALVSWRVPGDVGTPIDYATGATYGQFAINESNFNVARPFLRWLKGAQYLLVHEAAYSATKRVGAWNTADGKLIVVMVNNSATAQNYTCNIGPFAKTMRALSYSYTGRDTFASAGAITSNTLAANVAGYGMTVFVEV
jgi:hypothetical protein